MVRYGGQKSPKWATWLRVRLCPFTNIPRSNRKGKPPWLPLGELESFREAQARLTRFPGPKLVSTCLKAISNRSISSQLSKRPLMDGPRVSKKYFAYKPNEKPRHSYNNRTTIDSTGRTHLRQGQYGNRVTPSQSPAPGRAKLCYR